MNAPREPAAATAVQHVFRWDLDKTYLRTDFDTLLGILRTALERPERKRTVPGAAALIRELRQQVAPSLVSILSGSPEQMRGALESKLRLDGVQWDEFLLKPSLGHLLRLRLRAIREQVGYKLPALLRQRARVPATAVETLFGDDAEADALTYSLYADVLAGRVDDALLLEVLTRAGAYPDAIARTMGLVHRIARSDPVQRIFIHLDRHSDPAFFRRYGPRLVPAYNYFQAAVVLVQDGVLPPVSAVRLAAVLALERDFTVEDLVASGHDLVVRGHARPDTLVRLGRCLREVPDPFPLSRGTRAAVAAGLCDPPPAGAPVTRQAIEYLTALAEDRARWEAARQALRGRAGKD